MHVTTLSDFTGVVAKAIHGIKRLRKMLDSNGEEPSSMLTDRFKIFSKMKDAGSNIMHYVTKWIVTM